MRKYSVLLIIAGLLIVMWPTAEHWIQDYRMQKSMSSWEPEMIRDPNNSVETTMLELSKLFRDERTEAGVVQEPSPISGSRSVSSAAPIVVAKSGLKESHPAAIKVPASKPNQKTVVGILEIKDIELKLPVVQGVSSDNLEVGAGHISGTDAPGQIGNFVLAAHRSYSYGRLFNRLGQLNVGNEVLIRTAEAGYTYTIYEIKTVEPSDLSVLNRNKKDKVLTLITCTEDGSQRIVVHARLKSL